MVCTTFSDRNVVPGTCFTWQNHGDRKCIYTLVAFNASLFTIMLLQTILTRTFQLVDFK